MSISTSDEFWTSSIVQGDFYFAGTRNAELAKNYGYRMSVYSWGTGPGFSNIERFELKRICFIIIKNNSINF